MKKLFTELHLSPPEIASRPYIRTNKKKIKMWRCLGNHVARARPQMLPRVQYRLFSKQPCSLSSRKHIKSPEKQHVHCCYQPPAKNLILASSSDRAPQCTLSEVERVNEVMHGLFSFAHSSNEYRWPKCFTGLICITTEGANSHLK